MARDKQTKPLSGYIWFLTLLLTSDIRIQNYNSSIDLSITRF